MELVILLVVGVIIISGLVKVATSVFAERRQLDPTSDFPELRGPLPKDPGIPGMRAVAPARVPRRPRGVDPTLTYPSKRLSAKRVEAVLQKVGDLRTDLVWVIEHPSLFDGNTEASARFFEKLGQWEDNYRFLSEREAHLFAGGIEDAFTNARQAAERLGLDFYDESGREEADVAVKLVTKARSTTGPEARLLMDKVAEILARLLPFELPTAITAAPRPEGA